MPLRPLSDVSRALRVRLSLTAVAASLALAPQWAIAQGRGLAPDSLTSAEFWKFFNSMSEPGGFFLSENFVSNEVSFQDVIPSLQKTLTKDGVYLGVGPEQNFTYISNLAPRMAVIFDIRRQNAMQHLMYKALFELSPTRAEFVSRLFSRPSVANLAAGITVNALFDSATKATSSDSAYKANLDAILTLLTQRHGFALPDSDIETIKLVYNVFFTAGTEVNYGYRSGSPGYFRPTYPTYGMLQTATNSDTVQMAFLANEDRYRAVRELQLKNLVVPVVGNFGGPSAIKSVAKWLRERSLTVTAFYVSNVEQYLWREPGVAEAFYSNVSALPLDSTSQFIRSVPRPPTMMPITLSQVTVGGGPRVAFSISTDSRGYVTTQTFRDSAGVLLVKTTVDSSAARNSATRDSTTVSRLPELRAMRDSTQPDSTLRRMLARRDSIIAASSQWQVARGSNMQVVMGGTLTSGIAPMDRTLKRFFLGELKDYPTVVEMTRITGWR